MDNLEVREEKIITLADELLKLVKVARVDEATIDANYIFRFEPLWNKRVNEIRSAMRSMIGLTGISPMDGEEAARWLVHIHGNRGLQLITESGGKHLIKTHSGGYSTLNKDLREASEKAFREAAYNRETNELDRLFMLEWFEANQTSQIIDAIKRLGYAFGVVPSHIEFADYSQREIDRLWHALLNWVIYGYAVPAFRWTDTQLIESRTGSGIERTIRMWRIPTGRWVPKEDGGRTWVEDRPGPNKRMTLETRIRTWAIYFLSKRGGGRFTEDQAVEYWNKRYDNLPVNKRNYQAQRKRLFDGGSKKTIT